jgi:pyridoxal phosphate enzyme (YggS family)
VRPGLFDFACATGPASDSVPTTLETNLARLRGRIEAAARAAGRGPVELVAVTKSVDPGLAADLVRAGQADLGESRAAELEAKARELARQGLEARWHFVGHLQRNKARSVVERCDVIHSIDSLRLLETVARIADDVGRFPQVFLQVKLHPEETKSGMQPEEAAEALAAARELSAVHLAGLMTIAPLVEHDEPRRLALARAVFAGLARLARELAVAGETLRLSMGMSDDFELAIAEGSDCVRVGSALFQGLPARRADA